jgi:hypothetical protein
MVLRGGHRRDVKLAVNPVVTAGDVSALKTQEMASAGGGPRARQWRDGRVEFQLQPSE